MVHSPMNPSPRNTSGPRGASGARPSRPGRRRPAPGRLMGMRRLTRPRPRRRPRPVRPTSRSARPRDPGRDGAGEGPVATGVPSVSAKGRRAHLPPKLCAATTSHQCRRPERVARAIRARRAERRGPLMPFTVMALWHRDRSPQARPRKWVAPPPMLRYRLKRQTQAPGGEKTS